MNLFYRKYGNGNPVIILHGLFGISDNWVTHARRLSEKFEVFVPDQRNHGQSLHSNSFNYHLLVDDLLQFMEQLGLPKAILIGHSMGGKTAMNFALEYPHMVQKLVVIDISPRGDEVRQTHQHIIEAMNAVDFDRIKTRSQADEVLKQFIASERLRMLVLKNLYRKNHGMLGWRINLQAIGQNIAEIAGPLIFDGAYPGPTLFIKGSESDYLLEDDERLILKYFPNAYVDVIDGAGHWVHADAPDELCKLLSSFLGRDCLFGLQAGSL